MYKIIKTSVIARWLYGQNAKTSHYQRVWRKQKNGSFTLSEIALINANLKKELN